MNLNMQRWGAFILYYSRSILCIFFTTIKNIYDSYHHEQFVFQPPDERNIEYLELALHEPVAIDYLYTYLEQFEGKCAKKANYYRLLALYMDIRCFDEDIRKMNKVTSIAESNNPFGSN